MAQKYRWIFICYRKKEQKICVLSMQRESFVIKMQTKVIAGLLGLLWGGVCYEAGKVSQQEKNEDFSSQQVVIQHPTPKGAIKPQTVTPFTVQPTIVENPFISGLIIPPYRTISYPNFKILYSTLHKCPLAVYEHVTKQIAHGDAPRRATFFNQPSVEPEFQSTNDHFIKAGAYKNFYLARGHMAAAGNYSGNKQAKFQTFTYANVIPQNQHNNAGIWNTFERYSRDLVMSGKCESIDVVSGPIYHKNQPYKSQQTGEPMNKVYKQQSIVLLENGVVVPEKLYKIVQCNTREGKSYIDGFQFWNKKTFDNQKPLKEFKTSIASIEKQTGLKFGFGKKDQLTGAMKLPESLAEFDRQGFEKTKKTYDESFYLKLMLWSKTINQMNGAFFRAKEQHIFIPLDQFQSQTQQLFRKEVTQIEQNFKTNLQKTPCQTLNKLVKLNKELFQLKQLKAHHEEEIKRLEDGGVLEQCYRKANLLRAMNWEDLSEQGPESQQKKQKIALNSLTHAVTKQMQKKQEIRGGQQQERKLLSFVNESRLRDFIIPVNIQTSLKQAAKESESKK